MIRKTLMSLGMVTIIGMPVLAGCSQSNTDDVKSAQELCNKMTEALNNTTSYETDGKMKFDSEVSVLGQKINMSMDVDMNVKSTSEGDDETVYTSMDGEMKVTGLSALGAEDESQEMNMESYTTGKKDGSQFTRYTRQKGSEWTKSEINSNQDLTNFFMTEWYKDATFSKNGGKVNGRDTYKVEMQVTGDMINELLQIYSPETDLKSLGLDFGSLNAPIVMYVYKDDKLPAKVEVDIKGIDNIMKEAMKESIGMDGIEVDVDVKEFSMNMEYKGYNTLEKIEIPKEALEAK